MAGSRSAIKEGDLAPMCFQLIDFQMVAKLTVPGPFQPHRTLCETGTKKGKTFRFFLGSRPNTPNLDLRFLEGLMGIQRFIDDLHRYGILLCKS
jgi:hypothetical protein